jgi:hypothetical protein
MLNALFASSYEKLYVIAQLVFFAVSLAAYLYRNMSDSNIAALMRHRDRITMAHVYMRVAIGGFVLLTCASMLLYIAVMVHLGWFTSIGLGVIAFYFFIVTHVIKLLNASADESALAEVKLSLQFDDFNMRTLSVRKGR